MDNTTQNKTRLTQVIILIVGILIGLLIGNIFFNKDQAEISTDLTDEETEALSLSEEAAGASLASIRTSDQLPGETIIVDEVTLTEPGWIVVYTDLNGTPGSILGAQYFIADTYENLTVRLQAPTTAENTYYAMIHSDDGKIVETQFGRHQFDHTLDLPLVDSEGNKIKDSFRTLSVGARGL